MNSVFIFKIIFRQTTILFFLLLSFGFAHAQNPRVELPNTELRKIKSSIAGEDFLLDVQLPESYGKGNKKYPVIYLLDGHWLFPLVTGLRGNEYGDAAIPEMIIVGITWDLKNLDYDSLRQNDYTPSKVNSAPGSGHAAKFLSFIKEELIPFVESNYLAENKDRVLMGGSLGGLFVAYSLFQDTGLFSRYIIASPELSWDNDFLFKYEKAYSEKTSALNAKVFIAGGDEDYRINDILRFIDQLKSRNYKGLDLKTKVFKDLGHASTTSEGFDMGLKELFAKSSLSLDSNLLDQYVGTYQRKADDEFKLFRRGTQLMMQYSDKIIFLLHAETKEDFYIKGVFILFKFSKTGNGKTDGVLVNYGSGEGFYKKVE